MVILSGSKELDNAIAKSYLKKQQMRYFYDLKQRISENKKIFTKNKQAKPVCFWWCDGHVV